MKTEPTIEDSSKKLLPNNIKFFNALTSAIQTSFGSSSQKDGDIEEDYDYKPYKSMSMAKKKPFHISGKVITTPEKTDETATLDSAEDDKSTISSKNEKQKMLLSLTIHTIVNFSSKSMYEELIKKYKDEAMKLAKEWLTEKAELYKEEAKKQEDLSKKLDREALFGIGSLESIPKTVTFKIIPASIGESVEQLTHSIYNPDYSGTSIFRVHCTASIT